MTMTMTMTMTMRGVGAAAMVAALGGCSVDVDTRAAGVPVGSVGVRPSTTLPASSNTSSSAIAKALKGSASPLSPSEATAVIR